MESFLFLFQDHIVKPEPKWAQLKLSYEGKESTYFDIWNW